MEDLVATFDLWLQARMEQVHTMLPGIVQTYDPATRTATVKPMVKHRSLHGDVLAIPPVASVPVVWPSTSTFSLFGRLQQGDGVMLVVSESSMGNWQRGTEEADAEDETRFSLQDMVAVPGLWQTSKAPTHDLRTADWGMASEGVVLGAQGSKAVLENEVTSLREELERIYARLDAINGYIATQAAVLVAASTGALAPLAPGFTSLKTSAQEQSEAVPGDIEQLGRIVA